MISHLATENSVALHFIKQLRDVNVQSNRKLFRQNLIRLGEIFAYEISKTLDYKEISVDTPLGIAHTSQISNQIVLATILRAGLPLHEGLLNYFDDAENAFVSAYRRHHKDGTFEINLEYVSCPDLEGKTLIVADPMVATGSSIKSCLDALLEFGEPAEVHIVTVIASTDGVNYVKRNFPDAHFWIGEEDEELTAKSYIVPGLGDAGDLAYGGKGSD